jgi:hypothetical protein
MSGPARPGVDEAAGAPAAFGKDIAVEREAAFFEEHPLTPIAPLRDVVRQAGNDDAAKAGHPVTVPEQEFSAICKVQSKRVTVTA